MFFEMFNAKRHEKKRRPVFSKIHISETKAPLQRSRDTCLMDFDTLLFYHSPIAIWILWLMPIPW